MCHGKLEREAFFFRETASPCPCEGAGSLPEHGCSGERRLLKHERYYVLGMDALVSVCSRNMNGLCFGHGCSGERMLLEHERYYVLGMDALVSVCSWNMNGIMFWAWMLW